MIERGQAGLDQGVRERLLQVRERIAQATAQAGRAEESVRLVAVSKFQPLAAIAAAHAAGQRDFGENYAQELAEKASAASDLPGLRWHMIGNLQRNKVKSIVGQLHALQTADSLALVSEVAKRFEAARTEAAARLELLVEVSIAGEAQKHGADPATLGELLSAIEAQPSLSLRGLMCVPPQTERAADSRPHFERLRALRDQHGGAQRLPELSMGMTHDLEEAVLAGATIVRVGTAIFGARPAKAG